MSWFGVRADVCERPFFFWFGNFKFKEKQNLYEHLSFFCTRPALAFQLIAAGYEFKSVQNPWDSLRTAWAFEVTPELAKTVINFYNTIGRDLPSSAARVFKMAGVIQ